MAWIDYKKAYNIFPQSWIINTLKIYKISDKIFKNHEKLESGINNVRVKA